MSLSVGMIIPKIWRKKKVPNHQPVLNFVSLRPITKLDLPKRSLKTCIPLRLSHCICNGLFFLQHISEGSVYICNLQVLPHALFIFDYDIDMLIYGGGCLKIRCHPHLIVNHHFPFLKLPFWEPKFPMINHTVKEYLHE